MTYSQLRVFVAVIDFSSYSFAFDSVLQFQHRFTWSSYTFFFKKKSYNHDIVSLMNIFSFSLMNISLFNIKTTDFMWNTRVVCRSLLPGKTLIEICSFAEMSTYTYENMEAVPIILSLMVRNTRKIIVSTWFRLK